MNGNLRINCFSVQSIKRYVRVWNSACCRNDWKSLWTVAIVIAIAIAIAITASLIHHQSKELLPSALLVGKEEGLAWWSRQAKKKREGVSHPTPPIKLKLGVRFSKRPRGSPQQHPSIHSPSTTKFCTTLYTPSQPPSVVELYWHRIESFN